MVYPWLNMHSSIRRFLAFVPFAFVMLLAQWADAAVLMFPAEVTNVEPGEGEAIVAVIADAYATASGQQVTIVKADPAAPQGSYPERAKALGGGEYLVVRAVRLDEKIRIRVTRHKAEGTVIASESMTAISLDDMEPVAERLAVALVQETSTDQARTHRNVTGRETQAKNRMFNEKIIGIKAQLDMPFARDISIAPPVALGVDFKLEADAWFMEFGAGFMIPTPGDEDQASFGGLVSEIGGSFYLTDSEVSLYAGAGALPRILLSADGQGGANIALYGQFGAMFARSSSSRFYTDLRVAQNVTQVPLAVERSSSTDLDDDDPFGISTDYDTYRAYPTEIILEFGIGW
jgi:hypothetical protein